MRLCPACRRPISGEDWTCGVCGWAAPTTNGFPVLGDPDPESAAGFAPDHFAELSRLEAGHFWFRARNRILTWAVGRYLRGTEAFLEVGCGTGFVLQALRQAHPGLRLTGSELHAEGLVFARSRLPDLDLVRMDARRIPFRAHFDAIGCFDVLEHIREDEAVLAGFHDALRPEGWLLLTVPQHRWLWSVNDEFAHHQRRYTRGELEAKVRKAGFDVVRASSFVSLLLPLLLLSRRRRDARTEFDPLAEFRIAPWQQLTLGAVMALERLLLRAGFNWPVGGSLLLIARKEAWIP